MLRRRAQEGGEGGRICPGAVEGSEHFLRVAPRVLHELAQHLSGQRVDLLAERLGAGESADLLVRRHSLRGARHLSAARGGIKEEAQSLVEGLLGSRIEGLGPRDEGEAEDQPHRNEDANHSQRYVVGLTGWPLTWIS